MPLHPRVGDVVWDSMTAFINSGLVWMFCHH
jgi:hypothetical protein